MGDSGGAAEAGADAGPPRCAIQSSGQRSLIGTATSIDGLAVVHTTGTGVLAVVVSSASGGGQTSTAYNFPSDQPATMAVPSTLQGGTASNPTGIGILSLARRYDGAGTLLLGTDSAAPWLFDWADSTPTAPTPEMGSSFGASIDSAVLASSAAGTFYALAFPTGQGAGTYIDYEAPHTGTIPAPTLAAPSFNGYDDSSLSASSGARAFFLSDGTVSFLFDAPPGGIGLSQAHIGPPMGTSTATVGAPRVLTTTTTIPLVFSANGASVDVLIAEVAPADAGTAFDFFGATIPESSVFTFDPSKDLAPIDIGGALGISPGASITPCWAGAPGKFLFLVPDGTSGLDLAAADVTGGRVELALTGSSNLLSSDSNLAQCAIALASVSGSTYTFDLLWADSSGPSGQTLNYAPLVCTL
jgi:hypothetical protein